MIIKPSDKVIQNSKSRGELICELPWSVVIEDIQLQPASSKLLLTASKVRPEGTHVFRFGFSDDVITGPAHKKTVGTHGDVVTARVVHITQDGEFHSYDGDSGTVSFKYDGRESRLSGVFVFYDGDEKFEGEFHVVGYS